MNRTANAPAGVRDRADAAGFTLLELVVVMGILSGFLVMLVQLVDAGLRLFDEGEVGQQLADRVTRAERVIRDELRALRGASTGCETKRAEDRLLVQWLPLGLPPRAERQHSHAQVLRAAVHLPAEREGPLLDALLATRVRMRDGDLPAAELDRKVAGLRANEPLRGIGHLLLLPWYQPGADDALLELRAAWFLPGQQVPLDRDRFVDPSEVVVPGGPDLSAVLVDAITVPILTDLLHVEFLFWSQRTQRWAEGSEGSGGAGPERIWDSARGGWLVDVESGGVFAFDRGASSLADASDDIHPHAILVRGVVAQPAHVAPEGLVAEFVAEDDTSLRLLDGDRFPGAVTGGFVKIGFEWIRYSERQGDSLRGLRRGQRGTRPRRHDSGARVHCGRSFEFVLPLPHAKDDWNG
jgi:hypothetical protein